MPRTPLLRLFRRLAQDHAAAEELGCSPQELREQRAAAGPAVNRRHFLGTLAAGAGALAVGSLAPGVARAAQGGSKGKGKQSNICIVGGGVSGLACALQLADDGVQSTVYEAKGRVGGRMFSDRSGKHWVDGQVSEWGGELIDTGHKTIRQLCKRFGLPLDNLHAAEAAGSSETHFFGGMYYTEADADFAAVKHALHHDLKKAGYPTLWNSYTPEGAALDQLSVHDWIATRVPGGHSSPFGKLLDVAYAIEYGADTVDQSALNLVYLLGYQPKTAGAFNVFGESDETFHIRGGNQLLPRAMAAALPAGSVQKGMRLLSIKKASGGTLALTFESSKGLKTVGADMAVLSLPFAVLRNLDYSQAGFDALKHTAIQELGRSQNAKLMLQFGARLWRQAGPWGVSNGTSFSDAGYQAGWEVSRAQEGAAGMLVGYSGGSVTVNSYAGQDLPYTRAAGNPATAAAASALLAQLEQVFPGISATYNGRAELSIPPKDPDLQLAYSYWRVGQYTQFSGYEGIRQGNVFFAGEHCSQDAQGFMEGAAAEGQRAADEILAELGA